MINTYLPSYNVSDIATFVAGVNKTQSGLACVSVTEPRMRAPKSCPFSGRVLKVTLFSGFGFQSYENTINGSAARISGATADYVAECPSWAHYVDGLHDVVLESNKDANQHYLVLTAKRCNLNTKSFYLVKSESGAYKVATPEQMSEIANWLVAPADCRKQLDHGINPEQMVWRNTIKLQNVKFLTDKVTDAEKVYAALQQGK